MATDIEQRLEALQQSVVSLTSRVTQLEGQQKLAATAPVAPAKPTTKSTKVAQYPGLRGIAWVLGILCLFFGGLIPVSPLIGLVILLVAIVWPWKTTVAVHAVPSPQAGGSAARAKPSTPHVQSQFERDLAKHWFSWLGIISIVIGITLLLSFSLRDLGLMGSIITAYGASSMLFGLAVWFQRTYRSFGLILQSGGWATLFIATYSLHGSTGETIAPASVVGWVLLFVVAIMVIAALYQKSKALTAGAFFLGFVAALITPVTSFTLTALVILAAGLVLVATRLRWPQLIIFGTLATYFTYALWLGTGIIAWSKDFPTALGFLVLEAVIFGISHWILTPANETDRKLLLGSSAINLTGVFFLLQYILHASGHASGWIVTLFLAFVCGTLAVVTRLFANRRDLRMIYTVFAVSFLTVALGQKLHGSTLSLAFFIESAAVTIIGIAARYRVLRYLGYGVSFMALLLFFSILPSSEMFGLTTIHARLVNGLIGLGVFSLVGWYAGTVAKNLPDDERRISLVYGWSIIAVLTALLGAEITPRLISIAWGVEGVALFGLGFALQNISIRRQGLSVMIVTIIKVYLYDVQTLEPGARILSFIILGIILIVIGYLYNRWRQQVRKVQPPTQA